MKIAINFSPSNLMGGGRNCIVLWVTSLMRGTTGIVYLLNGRMHKIECFWDTHIFPVICTSFPKPFQHCVKCCVTKYILSVEQNLFLIFMVRLLLWYTTHSSNELQKILMGSKIREFI
jgi:hypothetical protein